MPAPSSSHGSCSRCPIAVLVNKVGGLYDRDELVLNKTTLDEAPALLQITGLFALLVWLGQDGVRR